MRMNCDLHGIGHALRTEVRVCGGGPRSADSEPFVMAELRVGGGYVTLFLSPEQALDLAHAISSALQAADQDDEATDPVYPVQEGH